MAAAEGFRFGTELLRAGDRVESLTGKVVHRSDVRQYSGGRFFTIHLMDDQGAVVGAKRWARGEEQEQANQMHALVPEGRVVTLSRCSVKPADRRYSSLASPVEITFQDAAETAETLRPDFDAVRPSVTFTAIADLRKDWSVNVCAVVHQDSGTTRVGAARKRKRDLVLVDASGSCVEVTLWEETIDEVFGTAGRAPVAPGTRVLVVEGARVAAYQNGVVLKVYRSSTARLLRDKTIRPATDADAFEVLRWYLHDRRNAPTSRTRVAFSANYDEPRRTVDQIADDLKRGTTAVGEVHVALVSINDLHFWYPAAPDTKRRLSYDDAAGTWCDRDGKTYGEPVYRFMVRALLYDTNGSGAGIEATLFDETVERLVGRSAQSMHAEFGTRKVRDVATCIRRALQGEWIARLTAKKKFVDADQTRVLWNAEIAPVEWSRELASHNESPAPSRTTTPRSVGPGGAPRRHQPPPTTSDDDACVAAGPRAQKKRRLNLQTVLKRLDN